MKKVGVTGAAGFIGSHLCERLLQEGCEVVGVDDLSYGSMANLSGCLAHPGFRFEVLDCTRRRKLRVAFDGCDAIAHLAAKKIPRYGGTVSTLEINVNGVRSACAVALSLGADLIVTSTSDVYGNAAPPLAEDSELLLGPSTTRRWAYAVSKLYDEHLALALAEERDLQVTVLRLFNCYGPNNHLTWWGGPVVTFTEALLDGEPMMIHGDGKQTRTFTYVTDTVEGFVRALRTPEARGEVINIGGTETVTIRELAGLVQSGLGLPRKPLRAEFIPYHEFPGRYQDVRERVPDTTKALRILGFEAKVTLAEGLAGTIAWHLQLRDADAARLSS
ncbi:MAG: NAD-dependent epimerase/dehydratase family protein [Gaiellaceae bacterium]